MKSILIIDDGYNFACLAKKAIQLTGNYKVEIATNGEDGIKKVKFIHPDLIFLDIIMPDMDGGSVAKTLKENTKTKNIPIVFLTGVAKKNEVNAHNGIIGGHHFLAKPIRSDELIKYLYDFFNKSI